MYVANLISASSCFLVDRLLRMVLQIFDFEFHVINPTTSGNPFLLFAGKHERRLRLPLQTHPRVLLGCAVSKVSNENVASEANSRARNGTSPLNGPSHSSPRSSCSRCAYGMRSVRSNLRPQKRLVCRERDDGPPNTVQHRQPRSKNSPEPPSPVTKVAVSYANTGGLGGTTCARTTAT